MDENSSFEKRATAIEAQFKEKLMNNKYYRSVNIDVTKEDLQTAEKAKQQEDDTKAAAAAKTSEDYKAILRGMGFNID
jgi:hypothetical protein